MNKEVGSAICRGGKVIGVVHTHPSGSPKLSPRDIQTAREKGLSHVCVIVNRSGKQEAKCYKFPKRK